MLELYIKRTIPINIFALTNSTIYPSQLFVVSRQALEIVIEMSAFSLDYTGTLKSEKLNNNVAFQKS